MYTLIRFINEVENSFFPIYVNDKLLKAIESSFCPFYTENNEYHSYDITDIVKRIESFNYYITEHEIHIIKGASIPIIPESIKQFLDSIISIFNNYLIINVIPYDERGLYKSFDGVYPVFSESYCENKFYWIRSYDDEEYTRNSQDSKTYLQIELDKDVPFIDNVKVLKLTEDEVAEYEEDYRENNIYENDDYEYELFIFQIDIKAVTL